MNNHNKYYKKAAAEMDVADKEMLIKTTVKLAAGIIAAAIAYKGAGPAKYSLRWFKTLSDEMLGSEREIIRQQYCRAGSDDRLYQWTSSLLKRFDREMSRRAAIERMKNPAPVKDANFRWTDANRWE